MSYLEFFELQQEPFSNAPVARLYYNSTQHQAALVRLMHVVSNMKGLALLVGDIGQGKTTLARRMLDSLPEAEYEAALLVIIHSGITASWLLKRIALQLGVEDPAEEKLALLGQLYQRLVQIYESGKKAVVLIDEAQMLQTREIMEEFRGLLNLEVPERKLLSFVFFGLPEIEEYLKLDPPLHQRVSLKYRLEPFDLHSTQQYVKHRLRLAGGPRNPFADAAVQQIHRFSRGLPRVINTLCDNALFEAYLSQSPEIAASLIERIAQDLGLREQVDAEERKGRRDAVYDPGPAPLPRSAPMVTPVAAIPAAPPTAPVAAPAPVAPAAPPRVAAPKIDLAEIDRYLEGLGKL